MGIRKKTRRVVTRIQQLPPGGSLLVGGVGWWLVGVALCIGPLAGFDEPYGTWVGAQHGMIAGAVASLVFSACLVMPFGMLPAMVVVVLRWNDRRCHRPARDFGPARAWLLSPWLVVPAAVAVSPFSMVNEAASQIVDPIEVPGWTQDTVWYALGHWNVALFLYGATVISACLCAIAMPVTTSGAATDRCVRCGYDRASLSTAAPCPECGQSAVSAKPRSPWTNRQWVKATSEPARAAAWLGGLGIAIWIGVEAWHAAMQYERAPAPWQIGEYVAVVASAGVVSLAARRSSTRVRARSLVVYMLLMGVTGIGWLCLTRVAELASVAAQPNVSPRAQPWWFFSVVNEGFLVPSLLIVGVCLWLGRHVPRYVEDEVSEPPVPAIADE